LKPEKAGLNPRFDARQLKAIRPESSKGEKVMKKIFKFAVLGFLLICAGCVPSLNPLYTEADLIFDAALLGVWTDLEATESWAFTSSDDKEYKLVYTDESGKKGEFKARLLKIEGRSFLDLTPVKPALAENDFYKANFLPTHTFILITQPAPNAQIAYLEPEWLKSFLAKNPAAIRHERLAGEILLTASTKDLQKFLLAHLNTPGAFSKPIGIKRR
jgi:hypothetical protein